MYIWERVLGKDHPDTATSYNNLAVLYEKQERYQEAEELYKKSLCIREKVLGNNHPDTATSYSNLAIMYDHQKKYCMAEKFYLKNLGISERILGKSHQDTIYIYNNLAGLYYKQGKYTDALFYFLSVYKALEFKPGLDIANKKAAYMNLETTYNKCNMEEDFKQWLEEKIKQDNSLALGFPVF